MIKRILSVVLLLAILLTNTVCFAEESAIAQLNDLETEIYEALLIMLEDFYSPSSARIMELGYYQDNSASRDPNDDFYGPHYPDWAKPDSIVLKIMGTNKVGGTINNYYRLFLTDWENPDTGKDAKSNIAVGKSLGMPYSVFFSSYCEKGFYEELSESNVYVQSIDRLVPDAEIGKINRALKEHWDYLGL